MSVTKEQERKALEKIKSILSEVGEGSYLGFAFEGCIELAEENINNDFALSMKERCESAEKAITKLKDKVQELESSLSEEKSNCATYLVQIDTIKEQSLSENELRLCLNHLHTLMDVYNRESAIYGNIVLQYAETPDTDEFKEATKYYKLCCKEIDSIQILCDKIESICSSSTDEESEK